MLEFNIRNQEISRIDNFSPAEKSVEYLIAKFNFKTEDWNGATKRAIFRNMKSKVEKDTMLQDDSCIVPWEVLVGSSDIEVSVHGVIGIEEITTDVAVFNLNRTLQGGSATQEPSPTVYEQMVEMVKDAKEVAQSVRTDADNGVFDGSQGPKGDSGSIEFKIVNELPTEDISESTMYLVSLSPSSENNEFAEYIYANGHWEYIGSATVEVDLSEYVKKDELKVASTKFVNNKHEATAGLFKYDGNGYGGLFKSTAGGDGKDIFRIKKAQHTIIDARTASDYFDSGVCSPNNCQPITPAVLDYAVKKALSDCKLEGDVAWTEEEKASVRDLLGIIEVLNTMFQTVTQDEYDVLVERGEVDENAYYYIKEE